jgi:hypothetical protein
MPKNPVARVAEVLADKVAEAADAVISKVLPENNGAEHSNVEPVQEAGQQEPEIIRTAEAAPESAEQPTAKRTQSRRKPARGAKNIKTRARSAKRTSSAKGRRAARPKAKRSPKRTRHK